MLRFEYPVYDIRLPVTPGMYFPTFTIAQNDNQFNNGGDQSQSSDSEQSVFDDFNQNHVNHNHVQMNHHGANQVSSLLSDGSDSTSSVEYYNNNNGTPLFFPKTAHATGCNAATNHDDLPLPPATASNNDLPTFANIQMLVNDHHSAPTPHTSGDSTNSEINDFPPTINDLMHAAPTCLPQLMDSNRSISSSNTSTATVEAASDSDDEGEEQAAKKTKTNNNRVKRAPARRGRKAAIPAVPIPISATTKAQTATIALSIDKRKPNTSDEELECSDSNQSTVPANRSKHSISETRRRTRLRNQFKYLAEAAQSAKTDRYSVLCAAIVKIEAAKRRIAELESALSAANGGSSMGFPTVHHSAMCCAESVDYGVCSQSSGVASALLTGDGIGSFLAANHRFLTLVGVDSLSELQSMAPSFLKVVGVNPSETANARSTLSAVSAHKHGSMTLPLDSNTILAYKHHSDASIQPGLLYANIRHLPSKTFRPALLTLSSYEHGAADNRRPCVFVSAVPCEALPEGVTISSNNDRLAHRGRKANQSSNDSSSSNAMNISNTGSVKKEGRKRAYSQRATPSSSSSHNHHQHNNNNHHHPHNNRSNVCEGLNSFVSLHQQIHQETGF